MAAPTISACIAVYNGVDHLGGAISSVLNQTIPVDEILVLDDGSTDGSAELASSFAGVRLIQQVNAGIGAARKRLIEEANCEWVAFNDHDDLWEPQRIEKGLPATLDADVCLVYSGVVHVDLSGETTPSQLRVNPHAASIDHVIPNPEDIWTSSTLLRRSAVLEAGNFDPSYRTGEDMLMWFHLASLGRVVQVPEVLVKMLRRPNSTSAVSRFQFESSVRLYEEGVLPNLNRWYPDLPEGKRAECRRLLEAKVGYTMSLLATFLEAEGDRRGALELYRKAIKYAPRSKGARFRYARSLLRVPAKPPR